MFVKGTGEHFKRNQKLPNRLFLLHSVIMSNGNGRESFKPILVAGHSLGEFSALVANGTLNLKTPLHLVSKSSFSRLQKRVN